MAVQSDYAQLAGRARLGDEESLNLLCQKARGELCTYIYRITLDFGLTDDIAQETLLEVVKAIKGLKDSSRFKWWLFRIASTKVKKHYRLCGNKRILDRTNFDAAQLAGHAARQPDALGGLLKKEVSQALSAAMQKLKYNHRNVLTLRCFEQMSYPDIAVTMGCSTIEAQLLFFRAKHLLKKQLARQGYRKKEQLLASLAMFAVATATPFKSAHAATAAVAPATLKVGAMAAVIGSPTMKIGILATMIVAAALTTLSATMSRRDSAAAAPHASLHIISPERDDRAGLHYPAAVAAAFHPRGRPWQGTGDANHLPIPASPELWLTKPPATTNTAVLIPDKAWLKLRFSAPIVDGPGDDIVIIEKCQSGEQADVFLADDGNHELFIGSVNVAPPLNHAPTFFACDISQLQLTFVPTAIRIQTTNGGYPEHDGAIAGFDLVSVRANLSK